MIHIRKQLGKKRKKKSKCNSIFWKYGHEHTKTLKRITKKVRKFTQTYNNNYKIISIKENGETEKAKSRTTDLSNVCEFVSRSELMPELHS